MTTPTTSHAGRANFATASDADSGADRRRPSQVSFSGGSDLGVGGGAGGTSARNSRRGQWREVLATLRNTRQALIETFVPRSKVGTSGSSVVVYPNWDSSTNSAATNIATTDAPAAAAAAAAVASRIVRVERPHAMRNRGIAALAIALSTISREMVQTADGSVAVIPGLAMPAALQSSPQSSPQSSAAAAASSPSSSSPSAAVTAAAGAAPFTVEDVAMLGQVPLDVLTQNMLTIFEAQDILQRCIAASPALRDQYEVHAALASVLLVDTEDDWGPAFEVAPRRLAYKASELEEALSDVLRRRGAAIVFFDSKALVEGMKQDELADHEEEDDDDETGLLGGTGGNDDGGQHQMPGLFNGSFGVGGSGRGGAPIAMQALRTRRTDIRAADCGFVLGATRQAESVALALTAHNSATDELELSFTEVTATVLLDAMAMRNAKTGRPQGFLALLPAVSSAEPTSPAASYLGGMPMDLSAMLATSTSNNKRGGGGGAGSCGAAVAADNSRRTSNSDEKVAVGAAGGTGGGARGTSPAAHCSGGSPGADELSNAAQIALPLITALEIVTNSTVTIESVFPRFVVVASGATTTATATTAAATSSSSSGSSDSNSGCCIHLTHVESCFATHITACATGLAAVTGTLGRGLQINDLVDAVVMPDSHMDADADAALQVHEVFAYLLQYTRRRPALAVDVEWCPVVQLVHRANAAATVSVEQLRETLMRIREASVDGAGGGSSNINNSNNNSRNDDFTSGGGTNSASVCMLVKVRIDIAVGTHGNATNGQGGGTRWLVVVGVDEDGSTAVLLDPSPKRFGLFWSVSIEQLHRSLTGHGFIVLASKKNRQKSASEYLVCRAETHQIALQASTSYDGPDSLPRAARLPPTPIARCPLSLAAVALSRISGANLSFSEFLRRLPHPTPYGFTEEISLAHFAHVTRTYCHETSTAIKLTVVHLSIDSRGSRAVDEVAFRERLRASAADPRHAVVVNYSVTGFTHCVRADRGTGSFALVLGYMAAAERHGDRVLLQDTADSASQRVFSVDVSELYDACCSVCSTSRRTMGFVDLRWLGGGGGASSEAEAGTAAVAAPVRNVAAHKKQPTNVTTPEASQSDDDMMILPAASCPSAAATATALTPHPPSSPRSGGNVSVAIESTAGGGQPWTVVSVPRHPGVPRHLFRSPGIPVLSAAAYAVSSLGRPCTEGHLVEASFAGSASATEYAALPTALQAKAPTLAVARGVIQRYLDRSNNASGASGDGDGDGTIAMAAADVSLDRALRAMRTHPRDVRLILQYDCSVVHSTIRKFVSAGLVSALRVEAATGGNGNARREGEGQGQETTTIRVLEAEIASFLDVWECGAEHLASSFDGELTGVIVLYRGGSMPAAARLFGAASASTAAARGAQSATTPAAAAAAGGAGGAATTVGTAHTSPHSSNHNVRQLPYSLQKRPSAK